MLIIRFQRVGRRNDPAFRIVVTERRSKPKGSGIETLGSYHPKTKQTVLKNERILDWISKGANVSDTVHNLLISKGVIKGKKVAVASPVRSKSPEATADSVANRTSNGVKAQAMAATAAPEAAPAATVPAPTQAKEPVPVETAVETAASAAS